ncbi:hypothetical protein X728_09035 [Mesorhizobium sp. L103C120A0]|nr:hypothetical protein X728_09035 [Mesorhizobium sp. L103C120A0]
MPRRWAGEAELAALIIARANAGKRVTLSPDTALFVGLKLMTASAKPTAAEVALMICDSRCERPCYPCQGKANVIVAAYGQSVKPPRS